MSSLVTTTCVVVSARLLASNGVLASARIDAATVS